LQQAYVSLVLRTLSSGDKIWLRCRRSTAEKFGWLNHFDEQRLGLARNRESPEQIRYTISKYRIDIGGHPIRICSAGSNSGHPKGSTFRLRVAAKTTNRDLAELAHFTEGSWSWLENKNHFRWTPEYWESHYRVAR